MSEPTPEQPQPNSENNQNTTAVAAPQKPRKSRRKIVFIVALVVLLLIIAGIVVYALKFRSTSSTTSQQQTATIPKTDVNMLNESLLKGDKAQALAYAKKVLAKDPHNIDSISAVASLEQENHQPKEATHYYEMAYNEFKKQMNPGAKGTTAITYWAAANMAEQAGQASDAKHYYQQVIKTADASDAYQKSLVKQSKAALERLSS